jgi:acetyl esterase/lipase
MSTFFQFLRRPQKAANIPNPKSEIRNPHLLFLPFLLSLLLSPPIVQAQTLAPTPVPAAPAATPPSDITIIRNLPYVPHAAPRQCLDLYIPWQSGPPRPLIAYIHGGAWRTGSKDYCPARRLVPLGYVAASIEYRFSQDAPFPAQIEDCKAAIRWLRAHARQYNIDPTRIGVWGASAGGHLVALLGVTGQVTDFDIGPNLDQSSAVQCVVDFFGPTDFLHYGDPAKLDSPGNAVDQLLGGPVATHQPLARSASPADFVTRDAAPFLILHGDRDPLVPLQQSEELSADLQKAGVECTLRVIPGAGHGGPGFNAPDSQKLIVDFLGRHLKPQLPGKKPPAS